MIDIEAATEVPRELLDLALMPYKPDCRYLVAARVALLEAVAGASPKLEGRGEFRIPSSAYIADTGHFNAVEFIICMNQLGFATIAQNVVQRLAYQTHFANWDLSTFQTKQLPSILILKVEARMRKQIDPRKFQGVLSVDALRRNAETFLMNVSLQFTDAADGYADGTALIAITDAHPPVAP